MTTTYGDLVRAPWWWTIIIWANSMSAWFAVPTVTVTLGAGSVALAAGVDVSVEQPARTSAVTASSATPRAVVGGRSVHGGLLVVRVRGHRMMRDLRPTVRGAWLRFG